ncbi:hypothetical protein [Tepidibacter hydrothermalis]|uniref:FG-GAP repeat protein n=1 Tax=Tepidibacter hydrothermalis TaxID=3036126 RepID=A0ABY8EBI7_9FIRM|nr:hypothetical protein [Tepidibacter hydrothermalis]WFD10326.1 hypothetical protein P4S50_18570 [Tepidibacter hydrothermalis]
MNKRSTIKKVSAFLITGALALGTIGYTNVNAENNTFKVGEKFTVADMKMGNDAYVIDYKLEDVTGDKVKDNIVLVGNKEDKEAMFVDNLNIIVQDGKTKKYTKATYEYFGGYDCEDMMFIGDFNGDKVNDVMVSAPTGGSGGIVEHMIATFKDHKPSVIFTDKDNEGLKIDGKYVDGYKAEVEFKDLNKKIELDLSANKKYYEDSNIYDKKGKLLDEVKPWINAFSKVEPIDYDCDGSYELHTYQRIAGTCNADTISYLESVLKFENNKWNTKELNYSTYLVK